MEPGTGVAEGWLKVSGGFVTILREPTGESTASPRGLHVYPDKLYPHLEQFKRKNRKYFPTNSGRDYLIGPTYLLRRQPRSDEYRPGACPTPVSRPFRCRRADSTWPGHRWSNCKPGCHLDRTPPAEAASFLGRPREWRGQGAQAIIGARSPHRHCCGC